MVSTQKQNVKTRLLVIDDDPVFRMMMGNAASNFGLEVTTCGSLKELKEMPEAEPFDVVVVDYYLDDFKKYIKGTDIAEVLGAVPVILVSSNENCVENAESWPVTIRKFAHKKMGAKGILQLVAAVRTQTLKENDNEYDWTGTL